MARNVVVSTTVIIAGIAGILFSTSTASAISRIETENKSCAYVQSRIAREGAAILRHSSKLIPGLTLFDRYVANRSFCIMGEVTESATVPTKDNKACPVLKCYRPDHPEREIQIRPQLNGMHYDLE